VLADFSELRVDLAKLAARGVGSKRYARAPVPAMKDAAAWAAFCDSTPPATRLVLQFDAPMTRAVFGHLVDRCCEEDDSTRFFFFFDDDDDVVPTRRATWLYSLMAHLQRPLHRDVEAALRRLCLRLLELRLSCAPSSPEEEAEAPRGRRREEQLMVVVQILLVVAGRYFGQATRAELEGSERGVALSPRLALVAEIDDDDEDQALRSDANIVAHSPEAAASDDNDDAAGE